jgi:hypothetical protein
VAAFKWLPQIQAANFIDLSINLIIFLGSEIIFLSSKIIYLVSKFH